MAEDSDDCQEGGGQGWWPCGEGSKCSWGGTPALRKNWFSMKPKVVGKWIMMLCKLWRPKIKINYEWITWEGGMDSSIWEGCAVWGA